MIEFLEILNRIVWGVPALMLILAVGLYLSFQTGFAQLRLFPEAVRSFCSRLHSSDNTDGVSSYRALCTALAATVGTGNIAGVAGAIAIGGPGAIFWMWVCAILGMVTKFAEATLAVRYRKRNDAGELVGGPMHMIQTAMPRFRYLAVIYCIFGLIASFGVGNGTQVNAVIGGISSVMTFFGLQPSFYSDIFIGVILAGLILMILLGGARRIGTLAEQLVPFAAVGYILLCVIVIIGRVQYVPRAFADIIKGAFQPSAMTGGIVGSAFLALRIGASRGVFTNEAGMGTAGIAHASANVSHPVEQGLMGIMEVFLDTVVICTMTALVILCSGVPVAYGVDVGVELTSKAFSCVLGDWVSIPIAAALCCFALATVLGWGLYGIRCAQFLFGERAWRSFAFLQAATAVISAGMGTKTVWLLAETVNGMMSIPNLIVLAYLTPELCSLLRQYTLSRNTVSNKH